jgi:pyridoxamine 5'-phosphate oxidase
LELDPIAQFDRWFKEAVAAQLPEPTAMTLATASKDGMPSARIVLLKNFDERGFTFFTNYTSFKGHELEENPQAALVFHWTVLERQVRVVGSVARVSREESAAYFASRPLGSRLGAWVSNQSQVIANREVLDQHLKDITARFDGQEVPLPPYWGGYRVLPKTVEFWQGRASRLHDRFRYTRQADNSWKIERLSP